MDIKHLSSWVSIGVVAVTVIFWYAKLQSVSEANKESNKVQWQQIQKLDERVRTIEIKVGNL